MKMKSKVQLLEINNQIIFIDSIEKDLLNKKVQRVLNKFNSYFSDFDDYILEDNLSHIQLEKIVNDLNKALTKISRPEVLVDPKITDLIRRKTYAINEQIVAGLTIKEDDKRWQNELLEFKKILDNEITRPLKPIQLRASFYLSIMKRAANFSVPGAGKTAMMYGTFAYLSSTSQNKIDKLLVISPINAFEAWRSEFIEVFQNKRNLEFMNLR